MYVEVIYETGRSSVANYDSDEEAMSALAAHHKRAKSGQSGGPVGAPHIPAERIAKALVYSKHPNEYNPDQTMSAELVGAELSELVTKYSDDNGIVNISRLAQAVQAISHPMVDNSGPHDSNFKMQEARELDLASLEGGADV